MQGLQRREALIERPAKRAEENQLEMERDVAQTEVGSNGGGVTIQCIPRLARKEAFKVHESMLQHRPAQSAPTLAAGC